MNENFCVISRYNKWDISYILRLKGILRSKQGNMVSSVQFFSCLGNSFHHTYIVWENYRERYCSKSVCAKYRDVGMYHIISYISSLKKALKVRNLMELAYILFVLQLAFSRGSYKYKNEDHLLILGTSFTL